MVKGDLITRLAIIETNAPDLGVGLKGRSMLPNIRNVVNLEGGLGQEKNACLSSVWMQFLSVQKYLLQCTLFKIVSH